MREENEENSLRKILLFGTPNNFFSKFSNTFKRNLPRSGTRKASFAPAKERH